jgi:hypothetical protein
MKGVNVATDSLVNYADLIVSGEKYYETRNSNSLNPYIGQRVGIIETKRGKKAQLVGYVTIGEPKVVNQKTFNQLMPLHLVSPGSKFDIKPGKTKHLYPIIDPIKLLQPIDASSTRGIVARDISDIQNDHRL